MYEFLRAALGLVGGHVVGAEFAISSATSGTKLGESSPCISSLAIHALSLTSVLRPGMRAGIARNEDRKPQKEDFNPEPVGSLVVCRRDLASVVRCDTGRRCSSPTTPTRLRTKLSF